MATDREARQKEAKERLEAAVAELETSEGFARWVETRSKFHSYSFNNTLLIAMQRPDATAVAGYRKWQELDRQVCKGEKAIKIFAPMGGACKACGGKGSKVFDGASLTCGRCFGSGRWKAFKVVSVFDVAQTDGEPLPAPPRSEPLEGDSHAAYLPQLETFADSLGISVAYIDTGSAGGYWRASDRTIAIDESAAPNMQVATLVHELAHAQGIGYAEYGREAAEVIVETVTAIVCAGIGLDTFKRSVGYVTGWGEGTDALKKFTKTIDEIARKLEGALDAKAAELVTA